MKKVVVVAALVLAIVVLGWASLPSSTVGTITELLVAWGELVNWASGDRYSRSIQAADEMQEITNRIEQLLVDAIQHDMTLQESGTILATVCCYVGMQIGTDAVRYVDLEKASTSLEIIKWASLKLQASLIVDP